MEVINKQYSIRLTSELCKQYFVTILFASKRAASGCPIELGSFVRTLISEIRA